MQRLLAIVAALEGWIVGLTIVIGPIVFLPITVDFYHTTKLYFLTIVTIVLLFLFALRTLISRTLTLSLSLVSKVLLVTTLAIAAATIAGSPNIFEAITTPLGLLLFIAMCLFLILADTVNEATINKPRHGPSLSFFLMVAALVLAILTIYQVTGITEILLQAIPYLRDKAWTPTGSLLTTIALLLISVPLFIQSIYNALVHDKTQSPHEKDRLGAVVMPLLGLAVILSSVGVAFYHIRSQGEIVQLPLSVSVKVLTTQWQQTKSLLYGIGLDSYQAAYAIAKPVELNQGQLWNIPFSSASSFLLHIATTTGLLGAAPLLLLLGVSLLSIVIKNPNKDPTNIPPNRWYGPWVSLLFLTLAINATPPHISYLFVWMGLVLVLPYPRKTLSIHFKTVPLLLSIIGFVGFVSILTLAGYSIGRAYASEVAYFRSLRAVNLGNGTEAYTKAIEAISLNPFSVRPRISYSQINIRLADNLVRKESITDDERAAAAQLISQSIREAKVAIKLNPKLPSSWQNLASIYEAIIPVATGADQWAIATYQQAAILDPTNPLIRHGLGSVAVSMKDYKAAIANFTAATTLKPDYANGYYNLANAYKLAGDNLKAIESLEKTLSFVLPDTSDYIRAENELTELKTRRSTETSSATPPVSGETETLSVPDLTQPQIIPPLILPEGVAPDESTQPAAVPGQVPTGIPPDASPSASP